VGEVSDGLQAVQKAEELQPDLILLDIGLPTINGIEAARRIREHTPRSIVLFLSAILSSDIAQEALRTGASGYVVKADAASELLTAVDAVLRGEVFVSSRLAGQVEISRRHEVAFYPDDASLVDGFSRSIEFALKAGSAVIVIATESHRASLFEKLRLDGVDVGAAIEQGSYISLDVTDTLLTFMANDLPDPVRFRNVAGDLITRAAQAAKGQHRRVAACGECAPALLAEGKEEAAVQLEHLWDEIARRYNTDILCGYLSNAFQGTESGHIFASICAKHSAVHGQTRRL